MVKKKYKEEEEEVREEKRWLKVARNVI